MSAPSTHLVLFIASVAVAASVAGAVTAETSRLSGTLEEIGFDRSDAVRTDIAIVTDAAGPVYDAQTGQITLHVQNMGESRPPHDEAQIDVFLDGEFQPTAALNVTVLGASAWEPDAVIRLTVDAPDLAWGDHRVKVAVDGDAEVLAFRNCRGVSRDSIAFEQNGNKQLSVINRSGVITDLGVKTDGLSPVMADFDCDGGFEVAYIDEGDGTINVIDTDLENHQLTDTSVELTDRRLGVGDLDGDGNPAVIYANGSDSNYLYRVEYGEDPERIGSGFAARSIGGIADFNGDGDLDIIYLFTNNNVYYLDDGTTTSTGVKTSSDLAIGTPMDFNGNGEIRVPIRGQTSNLVQLIDANGNRQTILSVYTDGVGSMASLDWNEDGVHDVLTTDQGRSREINYLELTGSRTAITDENGNTVHSSRLGVA